MGRLLDGCRWYELSPGRERGGDGKREGRRGRGEEGRRGREEGERRGRGEGGREGGREKEGGGGREGERGGKGGREGGREGEKGEVKTSSCSSPLYSFTWYCAYKTTSNTLMPISAY